MKKYFQSLILIIFIMLVVPILPLLGKTEEARKKLMQADSSAVSSGSPAVSSQTAEVSAAEAASEFSPDSESASEQTISVFQYQTEETVTLPFRDYLIGVVMAEMPANFHEEAVKAQTVIAHTYALHILQNQEPSDEFNGAQISTNPSKHQAYLSPTEAEKRFKDQYEEYYNKISTCVDAVSEQILTYEDQPIIAAFHAISGGATEDCSNVWGQSIPYLVPASSEGDPLSPNFLNTQEFSVQEVKDRLSNQFPDISFTDDCSQWFQIQTNTPSGYVDQLQILNITANGQEIRNLFDLRSASFSIEYSNDKFTFTTKGYGHGVGLSQYGADYFARQGMTYDQILAHYYPGTTLTEISAP